MKKLLMAFCLLCCTIYGMAQNDRFENYNQMVGKQITIYDFQTILLGNPKLVYRPVQGKLKAVPNKTLLGWGNSLILECQEMLEIKNSVYMKCKSSQYGEIYLNMDLKNPFISKVRNNSVWKDVLAQCDANYPYAYDTTNAQREVDAYSEIEWVSVILPNNSIEDEVYLKYKYTASKFETKISYSSLLAEGAQKFKGRDEYLAAYQIQYRKDSIQEAKYREMDAIVLPATCIVDRYSFGTENTDFIEEGDSIFVYYANEDEVKGWYLTRRNSLPKNIVKVDNEKQLQFLEFRGSSNMEFRDSLARKATVDYTPRYIQRMTVKTDLLLKRVEEREKELSTKQLFLKDIDYEFGEYSDFGLKFTIYNCWKKTIKYVEFTVTTYNSVGDVQRDWAGKSVSVTKGIGPLEPEESASWAWDDMFYDKYDVIDKARLTKIKFIFMDGSVQQFSGYSNINKHRW